jgi:uncharacterized protein (TIGR02271 family)
MSRVIALFEDRNEALEAQRELLQAGFRDDQLHLVERPQEMGTLGTEHEESWWEKVKSFFKGETGGEDRIYHEAARHGGILLSADVPEERVDTAADILNHHHPVDLDKKMSEWGTTGMTGGTVETGGEQRIPIAEEQLKVGKRPVMRGGVRIHTRVVETPVSENVELRKEHIDVERRPVDRPVSKGDVEMFQERTIEARATSEEAVVQKEARVTEEVVVHKDVTTETEQIREDLRRTEVDIEQLSDDDIRREFDTLSRDRGYNDYDSFSSAYRYGDRLGLDERYRGRDWNMIENDARTGYDNNLWDRDRDIIRRGYDRRAGRLR